MQLARKVIVIAVITPAYPPKVAGPVIASIPIITFRYRALALHGIYLP